MRGKIPDICWHLPIFMRTVGGMFQLLTKQAATFERPFPVVRPGYTLRVHQKVQEGGKERVQIFEGLVISVHKGHVSTDSTVTVRKLVQGIGVEKVFSLLSPNIVRIEVVKVAKVRRAKLFFLRGRRGKASRLQERFTNAGEFVFVPGEDGIGTPEAEEADDVPGVEDSAPEEQKESV